MSPVAFQVVSTARNGPRITNDEQVIRGHLRRVFGFTDAMYEPHVFHSPVQVAVVRKPTIVSNQTLIDVNYRWCTEYFHFFTEVLPNAMHLSEQHPHASILCTKSAFTEALFRWFGIRSPIVERISPAASRALSVFVQCGNPSRQAIDRLRSVVESKVTFEKTTGILIRRHKTRFIENEDELLEECKQTFPHLTWVIFDHLSIEDTAQMFSKAAVIVAPHGAGLTNMIFSPRGTAIYEFMPVEEPNVCYWHLSELLGNTYTMIPTPSDSATRSMKCKLLGVV